MLVENEFPRDTRVRNEAFTLASKGLHVSVIALRGAGEKAREIVNGVTVYRLPRLTVFNKLRDGRALGSRGPLHKIQVLIGYVIEYLYFTTACLAVSCYVAFKEGFDVVHATIP